MGIDPLVPPLGAHRSRDGVRNPPFVGVHLPRTLTCPTFLSLPSARSTFLALDLGGTNLRVCEVVLKGNHEFAIKQRKFKVSQELKEGEARVLFDYIADSIDAFLTEVGSELTPGEAFHLGFTFRWVREAGRRPEPSRAEYGLGICAVSLLSRWVSL